MFLLVFLISAWCFQAYFNTHYGWFSKTLMIGLGFYGIVSKNLKFNLKCSLYVSLLFITVSLLFITVAFITRLITPVGLRELIIDALWFFVLLVLLKNYSNEVFTRKYESILGIKYQWSQGILITGVFLFRFTASTYRC